MKTLPFSQTMAEFYIKFQTFTNYSPSDYYFSLKINDFISFFIFKSEFSADISGTMLKISDKSDVSSLIINQICSDIIRLILSFCEELNSSIRV